MICTLSQGNPENQLQREIASGGSSVEQEQGERPSAINSIDVGTVDVFQDMKKLLTQDKLGVRPTELCTCRYNDLKEKTFIKSISKSTHIFEGRIQMRRPWNGDGPP